MKTFSLFDGSEKFINLKPIRLIELFGGVQAQATALHELGVEFEHYRYVDFDKYAVKSANAMYGTNFEPLDITKISANDLGVVETENYCYIMTYSFPCTDLSMAGKGAGMQKGSGTRSGLLWEVERLLNEMHELPQVLLMENVPQVHWKKNIDSFREWQSFLESKGYKSYWQDLKATDFGIPQSRNRTFMVSLLGNYCYAFPKPIKLEYLLNDLLEGEVEEKYYLSDKALIGKINSKFGSNNLTANLDKNGIEPTLMARDYKDPKLVQVGNLDIKGNDSIKRVYSTNGLSPTLTTMTGGNRQPKIQEQSLKQQHYLIEQNGTYGYYSQQSENFTAPPLKDLSRTLKANMHDASVIENLRIRKLTPKEYWRLMGFRDELFEKAEQVNSNAQLYKQAGNSIVVTVLMAIFGELLDIEWQGKVKKLVENLKEFKASNK